MVALINADVKKLDCDDNTATPDEKLGLYEEEWNLILKGEDGNASPADLQTVLVREGRCGNIPSELYAKPPFSLLTGVMKKHGLATTDVQTFLQWKAKNDNVTKAREAKLKKRPKKTVPGIKGAWLLERKKKQPSGNF